MDNSLIKRQAAIDALKEHRAMYCDNTPDTFSKLSYAEKSRVDELDTAIATLVNLPPAQPHWIPCSERLPNCNGCYLVWRPHFFGGEIGMPAICYFDGQNTWHDSYGVDFERTLQPNDVTAWMPLPDPYKGEQHEVD